MDRAWANDDEERQIFSLKQHMNKFLYNPVKFWNILEAHCIAFLYDMYYINKVVLLLLFIDFKVFLLMVYCS